VTTPSPCTICGSGKACSSCSNAVSSDIIGGACPCAPGQNVGSGCLGKREHLSWGLLTKL